jgi:hypothetical protein
MLTYPKCTSTDTGILSLVFWKLLGENTEKTQQPQGYFLHLIVGKSFAEFVLVDGPKLGDGLLTQLLRYGHALNLTGALGGKKSNRFALIGKLHPLWPASSTGGEGDSVV